MQEIHINQFAEGIDKDTDLKFIKNLKMVDAVNMEITGDGKYFALKNIKGTSHILDIIDSPSVDSNIDNVNILAAFECKCAFQSGYYSGQSVDEKNECVIIYSVHKLISDSSEVSRITLYDISRDFTTILYETSTNNIGNGKVQLSFPLEGVIDGSVYGERGIDNIYFTDGVNTVRKISLYVESTFTTKDDARILTLRRYAAFDYLLYKAVVDGGYLYSGSYQFSYQWYNSRTLKESCWSDFTNPIPIYPSEYIPIDDTNTIDLSPDRSFLDAIYGGLPGEITNKKIVLSIEKTQNDEYYEIYDSLRLAVAKNIDGNKVHASSAYITPPIYNVFDFISSASIGDSYDFEYDGNLLEFAIDIKEISIDDANIKTFKTLMIKDNILFGSNITYNDLNIDNVEFTEGYAITKKLGLDSSVVMPNTTVSASGVPNVITDLTNTPLTPIAPSFIAGTTEIRIGVNAYVDLFSNVNIENRVAGLRPQKSVSDTSQNAIYIANTACNKSNNSLNLGSFIDDLKWTPNVTYDPPKITAFAMRHIQNLFIEDLSGFPLCNRNHKYSFQNGEDADNPIIQNNPSVIYYQYDGNSWSEYLSLITTEINNLGYSEVVASVVGNEIWFSYTNPTTTGAVYDCSDGCNAERHYMDGYLISFAINDFNDTQKIDPVQPSDLIKYFEASPWYQEDNSSFYNSGQYYYGRIENPKNSFSKHDYGYKNPLNCANYRGYFRDEVERFGITYKDEFGNWSQVKTLIFDNGAKNTLSQIESRLSANIDRMEITATNLVSNSNNNIGGDVLVVPHVSVGNVYIPPKCTGFEVINNPSFVPQLLYITYHNGTRTVKKIELNETIFISNVYNVAGTDYRYIVIKGQPSYIIAGDYITWGQQMYSLSENKIDFKFPSREDGSAPILSGYFNNGEFPSGHNFNTYGDPDIAQWTGIEALSPTIIIDDAGDYKDNGFINALGLRVRGIKNHPSWAKAFKIVRQKRKRNILSQSILGNCVVIQPYIDIKTDASLTNGEGFGYDYGSVTRKRFSFGPAYNIYRTKVNPTGSYSNGGMPLYRIQEYDGNDGTAFSTFGFTLFPEFIYNLDGNYYFPQQIPANTSLVSVDALSMFMSGPYYGINVGENVNSPLREFQTIFSSDFRQCYYYNNVHGKCNLYNLDFLGFDGGNDINSIKIKDYYRLYPTSNFVSLPEEVRNNRAFLNKTILLASESGLSRRNYGQEVFGGYKQTECYMLKFFNPIGDITMISSDAIGASPLAYNIIDFDKNSELDYFGFSPNIMQVKHGSIGSIYPIQNRNVDAYQIPNGNTGPLSTSLVVNLVTGADDFRYGEVDKKDEWIDTGAYYVLKQEDIDNNNEIGIDVWGGDCFITRQAVKLNNTTYTIDIKNEADKIGVGSESQNSYFTNMYLQNSEMATYYVESEINTCLSADKYNYPVSKGSNIISIRNKKDYLYHFGYSLQNEIKISISLGADYDNTVRYPSRIVYSDPKIYQSELDSFSRFRALSTYDLDETYGAVTKLILINDDNSFAVQENGVCNLNIGKNVIEQADGTQLVVNNSVLFSNPRYISTVFGSSDLRSVTTNGFNIYFTDSNMRRVYGIGSNGEVVSDNGMDSYYKGIMKDKGMYNINKSFSSFFDFNRDNLWVYNIPFTYYDKSEGVLSPENKEQNIWHFNTKLNNFYSSIVPSEGSLLHGVNAWGNVYLFGINNDNLSMYKMYDGNYGLILKEPTEDPLEGIVQSSVSVCVNPICFNEKVFDNIIVNSNNALSEASFYTNNDSVATNTNLSFNPRQSTYEAQILRYANGGRARGLYMVGTFVIDNLSNEEVAISQILTKYRKSSRNVNE